MNTKTCSKCKAEKAFGEFHVTRANPDGRACICKSCQKAKSKEYYLGNKDKFRERWRADGKRPKSIARKKAALYARIAADPHFKKSHDTVFRAIKRGDIIRPDHCERCLINCYPQAHHDDHSKDLEIMWLCPICHAARHAELKAMRQAQVETTAE
jgi:hypothetical protein